MPSFLALLNVKYLTPMTSIIFLVSFGKPLARWPFVLSAHLVLFQSLLSLLCCLVKDAAILLKFTVLAEYIFITLTVIGLLWLRKTKPQLLRPIKVSKKLSLTAKQKLPRSGHLRAFGVKVNLFFPIAFLVICILVILISCIKTPFDSFVCIAIILAGLPVYYVCCARKMSPGLSQKLGESTCVFSNFPACCLQMPRCFSNFKPLTLTFF